MTVGIITCMTCMFAVALTLGGPIRRQASQSEKTVPIGGNVTLMCPLPPDDLWIFVYWKKNDHTIYSLEVKSKTTTTNDTRYEGSNHATRITIKDLKRTDSGIYHCKVVTLVSTKERGQVLLSVTDQEVGLSTTPPGISFTASKTIPTQAAEDKSISSDYLIVILIISIIISVFFSVITVCLVFMRRERERNLRAGCVSDFRRLEGTRTDLLSSDQHGRDDVDVDDRPEESSNASQSLEGTRTDSLSLDQHGRDDVNVDDRPEESSNASKSLKLGPMM